MLIDHLHDEGRHAIFFSDCFAQLWHQLSISQKDYLVPTSLKALLAFCQPDEPFLQSIFKKHPSIAKVIINDITSNWKLRIPAISKITLQAIKRTKLLKDERYAIQFRAAGLPA